MIVDAPVHRAYNKEKKFKEDLPQHRPCHDGHLDAGLECIDEIDPQVVDVFVLSIDERSKATIFSFTQSEISKEVFQGFLQRRVVLKESWILSDQEVTQYPMEMSENEGL